MRSLSNHRLLISSFYPQHTTPPSIEFSANDGSSSPVTSDIAMGRLGDGFFLLTPLVSLDVCECEDQRRESYLESGGVLAATVLTNKRRRCFASASVQRLSSECNRWVVCLSVCMALHDYSYSLNATKPSGNYTYHML